MKKRTPAPKIVRRKVTTGKLSPRARAALARTRAAREEIDRYIAGVEHDRRR